MEDVGARLVLEGQAAFLSGMQKATALGVAFGQAIYNAALAAGKAFVDFAGDSIAAASDLNETISKSQVVFGSAAGVVERFASTSASALGMSKNAAIGAAATYGNLFRSMGMGEQASATMSTNLVQLAADLASFNNIDPSEALDKLRAGLTGESEPLKTLGININETLLRQEALNMGLVKGKEPLTALAKAQASYSLIMKQTSLAQGDFARTAGGLANQQRIFAANLENTKAALGTALLPIINKVMNGINKLFSNPAVQAGIQKFIDGISKVGDTLGKFFDGFITYFTDQGMNSISDFFYAFANGLFSISDGTGILQDIGNALFVVGDFLNGITSYLQDQGITSFGDFFYALANGFLSISNGTGILQDIGEALFIVGDTVNSVMIWIQNVIQTALAAIQAWWAENGTAIIATVTKLWTSVSGMFQSAVTFISTLINWLVTNIQKFWTDHGAAIMKIVGDLWVWVQNAFTTATGAISLVFQAFTALLQGNWQGFTDKLLEAWDMLWGFIKQAAEAAWANLSAWFQTVIAAILNFFNTTDWGAIGRGIIDGIWNALKNGWGWLIAQVKALAQSLFDAAMQSLMERGRNSTGGGGVVNPNQPQGIQSMNGFGTSQNVRGMLGGMSSIGAGPVTYNNNYAYNYNLNLTTQQTAQTVRQSFAIMQMLAG